MLKLRPYQSECVDAMSGERSRRAGIVLPTGAGKTVVFADFARRWRDAGGSAAGDGVLVLAHRDELIQQAVAKLRAAAPYMGVGIVKGPVNQLNRPIVVASVPSLARNVARRQAVLRRRGLIIVDEAHHAAAPSYRAVLADAGCYDDDGHVQAFGFTATMSRGDGLALGEVWQTITFERSIGEMIRDGYLVRPSGRRVFVEDLDFSKVRVRGGDYSERDLGEALEQSLAPETIAKAYAEHAAGKQGLIFTPTVATAELMRDAMRDAGFTCEMVSGATPTAERRGILDRFMSGHVQVISNCMVLTEGTDLPPAEVAVIARPTRNPGLYVQMVGRILRPWPGKSDALVIDVVGASTRHSLNAGVDLFGETDEAAERAVRDKRCLECGCDDWDLPGPCDLCGHEHRDGAGELGVQLDDFAPDYAVGELQHVEVDLFHGSASMWLRTLAGVRYLPAGDRLIALLRSSEVGCWDVVEMPRVGRGSAWVVTGIPDLSYAMAHAEAAVTPAEAVLARKERNWRAKRPSDAQLWKARSVGVAVDPAMTAGEVSNLISQKIDSWRIDPHLKPYMI